MDEDKPKYEQYEEPEEEDYFPDYDEDEESDIAVKSHKEIRIVPSDERVTSSQMTPYEMVHAVGSRIGAIENGDVIYTDISGLTSVRDMAIREFKDQKTPYMIRRAVDEGPDYVVVEEWKISEMSYPKVESDISAVPEDTMTKKLS